MKTAMKLVVTAANGRLICLLAILSLLTASTVYARDNATVPKQAPSQYNDLKQTIQAALKAEKKNLSITEKSLQDHETRSRDLIAELDLQKIQFSTFSSLLLASEKRIDDLEKATLGIRTAIEKLDGRQAELKDLLDTAQKLAEQLKGQKTSTEQQLTVLKTAKSHTPEAQALIGDITALLRTQSQRGEILERLQTSYLDLIARIAEARQEFIDLMQKFSLGIQEKKRTDLFQRTVNPLISLGWKNISTELRLLGEKLRKIFSLESFYMLHPQSSHNIGIFPKSLSYSTPPRVSCYIDIRCKRRFSSVYTGFKRPYRFHKNKYNIGFLIRLLW